MPAAIPAPLRQRIWECVRAGVPVAVVAESLGLSERTVRHLARRVRLDGKEALAARYAGCGRAALQEPPPLVQEALAIRNDHPAWGAGVIRVFLRRRHPKNALPSERTLQRWFQRTRLPNAPAGRRPVAAADRAVFPHDVWQMDAADQVRLQTGDGVCWLRLVDECSGAFLQTVVFPPTLLGTRQRCPRAAGLATGIFHVGTASRHARGQRQTVGIVE